MTIHFDREKERFIGINDQIIKDLQKEFPGKDVVEEFYRMRQWLLSQKGRTTKGTLSFIRNWLKKGNVELKYINKLRPFLDTYLEALWKGREQLLTLNTISH